MADTDVKSVVLVGTDGVPYEASGSGVSQTDGSAFTPNTSSMVPVGGLYESTPSAVTDGDAGTLGMTANRVLKAALHDAAGAAITTLPVSLASVPSHAVTNAGTFAVQAAGDVAHDSPDSGGGAPVKVGGWASDSAPTAVTANDRANIWVNRLGAQMIAQDTPAGAGADTVTSIGALSTRISTTAGGVAPTAVAGFMFNGTSWDRIRGETTNGLDVDVTRSALPTGASTLAEQQTQTTALQLIDDASVVLGTATYTEASSSGRAIAAVRRDADTTLVGTTNEWGPLQMDANGRLKVEVFSGETLPVSGTVTANLAAGTNNIGDVDVLSIAAGTNLIGDVALQPRTSNGLDTFMASASDGSSILVATDQQIKATAGLVYGYYVYNPEAAVTFLHFYNATAANVTVGTTSPLMSFAIPAGAAANLAFPTGVTFGTAITVAATTTAGGNTAPATGLSLVCWYK